MGVMEVVRNRKCIKYLSSLKKLAEGLAAWLQMHSRRNFSAGLLGSASHLWCSVSTHIPVEARCCTRMHFIFHTRVKHRDLIVKSKSLGQKFLYFRCANKYL